MNSSAAFSWLFEVDFMPGARLPGHIEIDLYVHTSYHPRAQDMSTGRRKGVETELLDLVELTFVETSWSLSISVAKQG
jgi:hypothetical protein